MKFTHRIMFHVAVITALCWSKNSVTWFEAQTTCRNRNQTLTLQSNESDQFYWTGFSRRSSRHWIKIMGCFNVSTLHNYTSTDLSLFSPPLCQEYCLQRDIHLFAVQRNKCLCLSSSNFRDNENQLNPSACIYTCNDTTLLSTDCGGESAFNVYRTDTTVLEIKSRCLSLQCGTQTGSMIYGDIECKQSLQIICSNSTIEQNVDWKNGLRRCKEHNSYLLWNITLQNITAACKGFTHDSQRWIGVVKDLYLSTDHGEVITDSDHNDFITCQKCKRQNNGDIVCQFVLCSRRLEGVFCTESVVFPQTGTADATGNIVRTSEKDYSIVQVIVPVVIVLLLILCGFAVAIFIYIRRKKDSHNDVTKGGRAPTKNDVGSYSNTEIENNKNYFVPHQKSNPTYQLADNSVLQIESPYNETEDGTYDHLGNKDARRPVNDIYNHASIEGLSDLSDYDVANRRHLNNVDNPYDCAADNSYDCAADNSYDCAAEGDNAYGKIKSDLSDYSLVNSKQLNENDVNTYDHAGVEDDSWG